MNELTKFTKGIWDWEHDDCTSSMIQVDSDIGVSIARLQSENDAYLISAAPEMYELLEFIANAPLAAPHKAVEIKKLLAKARGEL